MPNLLVACVMPRCFYLACCSLEFCVCFWKKGVRFLLSLENFTYVCKIWTLRISAYENNMGSYDHIPEATRVVWYNTEVFKFVAVEAVKIVITLLIERYS